MPVFLSFFLCLAFGCRIELFLSFVRHSWMWIEMWMWSSKEETFPRLFRIRGNPLLRPFNASNCICQLWDWIDSQFFFFLNWSTPVFNSIEGRNQIQCFPLTFLCTEGVHAMGHHLGLCCNVVVTCASVCACIVAISSPQSILTTTNVLCLPTRLLLSTSSPPKPTFLLACRDVYVATFSHSASWK